MSDRPWEVHAPVQAKDPLAGKTIQDFLYFEGVYNPVLRFAFTNVLGEDFKSYWNGRPYTVKSHQSVKLQHHLAVKFTKELVDKMMQDQKLGMMLAVPGARKPFEDKVLSILPLENSQELEVIKQEFVEQIQGDADKKPGVAYETVEIPNMDFDDLRTKNFDSNKVEAPAVPKFETKFSEPIAIPKEELMKVVNGDNQALREAQEKIAALEAQIAIQGNAKRGRPKQDKTKTSEVA